MACNGLDGDAGAGYYSFNGTMPTTDAGITSCFNAVAGRVPVNGDTFVAYNESTCKTSGKQYCSIGVPLWQAPSQRFDGSIIVTGTVGAAQLAANSISGEKIQANSTIIVGCRGATTKNVVGLDGNLSSCWRIYAGCNVPTLAPFRVDCLGRVYVSNATVSGTICATAGTFKGTVCGSTLCGNTIIGNTICGGTICGSTGVFCGTLCVNNLAGNVISMRGVTTACKTGSICTATLFNMYCTTVVDSSPNARVLELKKPHPDYTCCRSTGQCSYGYFSKRTQYCLSNGTWITFYEDSVTVPVPVNCAGFSAKVRYCLALSGTPLTWSYDFAPTTISLMVAPQGTGLTGCAL
jgi:hypothetical protein